MKIRKLGIALIVTLLLAQWNVRQVNAQSPPVLPATFYGTITFNGNTSVPDGTIVRALIAGVEYGSDDTFTSGVSRYGFLAVKGDDLSTLGTIEGGKEGDTVEFWVNGFKATETGVWHSGVSVNLNLTFDAPTAVTLASFSGSTHLGTVQLNWETGSEVGLEGFNVWRADTLDGVKQKRNPMLIPAQYPGLQGGTYQWSDVVSPGRHYYWVELVFNDKFELSDPVMLVTDYLILLPLMRK